MPPIYTEAEVRLFYKKQKNKNCHKSTTGRSIEELRLMFSLSTWENLVTGTIPCIQMHAERDPTVFATTHKIKTVQVRHGGSTNFSKFFRTCFEILIANIIIYILFTVIVLRVCSLFQLTPRGWIQEIQRMYPVLLMHAWFIFNLNTK